MVTPRLRAPKKGRPQGKHRINGRPWCRTTVEIAIYMPDALLDKCNEAFMKSDHRYFSRWVCEKLEEALK